MANSDNGSSFVVGFLVGGLVGAVVGLMLAPRSGSDTRAELAGRSEAWRTRAEEMAANLRERVGPTVETARERINPAVESVMERVNPVIDQVNTRLGRTQQTPEPEDDGATEVASSSNGSERPAEGGV